MTDPLNNPLSSVEIDLSLLQPQSQIIDVTIKWKPSNTQQRIILPNWTPGSYTIRDHSQYLFNLSICQQKHTLKFNRISTNLWTFSLDKLDIVTINYNIIASENTVRTCYVDNKLASLCLPALIVYEEHMRYSPHTLKVHIKPDWNFYTPLPGDNVRVAKDYDELVDSPLHAGTFLPHIIKVNNYEHKVLFVDEPPFSASETLLNDFEKICESTCKLMNTDPPAKNNYQFVIQFAENHYGGLEHDNSSVIQYCWRRLSEKDGYRKFLQLLGHEYLHQWNVRRLRPKEYIKYDYINPVISENLWFAEGVTSYFDIFLPYICNLSTQEDLYTDISTLISRYLNTPGRKKQSLSESSEEAWIKLYKSTPSSIDTQVSYYNLGALTSLCLDLMLRDRSSSLIDLFRSLWSSQEILDFGYSRDDILSFTDSIDNTISRYLIKWLETPDSLNIEECLSIVGLGLRKKESNNNIQGMSLKKADTGFIVTRVELGSPAMQSGLIKGDNLIAIDSYVISQKEDIGKFLKLGTCSEIYFSRKGRLLCTKLDSSASSSFDYKLFEYGDSTNQQKSKRNTWLNLV